MKARDYRARARAALKGRWLFTTLLVLLAMILGAGSLMPVEVGSVSLNLGTIFEDQDVFDEFDAYEDYDDNYDYGYDYEYGMDGLEWEAENAMTEAEAAEIVGTVLAVVGSIMLLVMAGAFAYSIFLGSFVRAGMVNLFDSLLDGEKPRAGMLFPGGVYWSAVKMNLLRGLYVFLWSLLLFIPGIIAAYRYSMADYLVHARPGIGAREALRESAACMKGRKWRMFCLELSFIGWTWLSFVPFVVLMIVGMLLIIIEVPVAAFFGVILLFLGVIVMLSANLLLASYKNASAVAFWRDAQRSAQWHEEADTGAHYAETAYGEPAEEAGAEAPQPVLPMQNRPEPVHTVLTADETVAKDMFLQHKCSRELMSKAGLLQEYCALNPSPISEERWKRDYGAALMRRFDQDPDAMDDLLALSAEYAMDDLADRALQRIERHIRQQTLPDAEILNMCGRVLALLVSGRFADNPGFVNRKKEQISDMADRLEHRLKDSATESRWNEALILIRRMCE